MRASSRARCSAISGRGGFSLVELLVGISIVAGLLGVLVPALGSARDKGRGAVCLNNLRQLGAALAMYGNDYNDRCMPLSYWSADDIGSGPVVYWWGTSESGGVDHTRGFVFPYLQAQPAERSVFECPMQPWGSYRAQGAAKKITSTYGYNGYYLSPSQTPGWAFDIGHRPWLDFGHVRDTAVVFAFADALIDMGGSQATNCALLDPPFVFSGGEWSANPNPTTSFRHGEATTAVCVDGHAERIAGQPEWIVSRRYSIGSVGGENGPRYVPDWREWGAP